MERDKTGQQEVDERTMVQPKISIVIPCFNAGLYLAATMDSVVEQSYPNREILVIDDGSTDDSPSIIQSYGDRISCHRIPNSGGPSRPRNLGIDLARGDLVAFFDSDDLMLPGKLEKAARVFVEHPEVDFLFTNFQKCDEEGRVYLEDFLAEYQSFRGDLQPTEDPRLFVMDGASTYRSLLRANFIGTSSVVCRASVFERAGTFEESMGNAEDADLWLRIARTGHTFALLDESCHIYRARPGSVSRGGSKMFVSYIKVLERQLPHLREEEDLTHIQDRIHRRWLGYGYALRKEGNWSRSREAYRTALGKKFTLEGIRGLVCSSLRLG